MTKSRNILGPRRLFSDAEKELMRRNYANSLTSDLAKVLGIPEKKVHSLAKRLGLKKSHEIKSELARVNMANPDHPGRACQFKPGSVPSNKGKKMPPGWSPGAMSQTQFKKGMKPHTWVPVGSYRINGEGYLDRKVNDLPGPNHIRWHPVHRLVWEEVHGPVPAGHLVVFKPGRRTAKLEEITLDAVECIDRTELMRRNTIHNNPPELADLMRLRGVLTRAINRKSKGQTDEQPT
jgi:hypothetical protein